MIIAVDGHSSCGKSTLAKDLARVLGFTYIDSGAMYRAVTLAVMRSPQGLGMEEGELIELLEGISITFLTTPDGQVTHLNGESVEEEIRGMEVSSNVSEVASWPAVRERLVDLQRELAANHDVIMDGRDIGTTVFPDADLKLFVTASIEERTRRRHLELESKGLDVSEEEVQKNLRERDHQDSTREISPLRQAEDAVVLDNTYLDRDGQVEWVEDLMRVRGLNALLP